MYSKNKTLGINLIVLFEDILEKIQNNGIYYNPLRWDYKKESFVYDKIKVDYKIKRFILSGYNSNNDNHKINPFLGGCSLDIIAKMIFYLIPLDSDVWFHGWYDEHIANKVLEKGKSIFVIGELNKKCYNAEYFFQVEDENMLNEIRWDIYHFEGMALFVLKRDSVFENNIIQTFRKNVKNGMNIIVSSWKSLKGLNFFLSNSYCCFFPYGDDGWDLAMYTKKLSPQYFLGKLSTFSKNQGINLYLLEDKDIYIEWITEQKLPKDMKKLV